jgi:hypothetical protein
VKPAAVAPPADSRADDPLAMRRYVQKLNDKGVSFEMVPIPGGEWSRPGSRARPTAER